MSVLTDIIIADPNEAKAILESGSDQLIRWPRLEGKGVDAIKLGTLWAVLSGGSLDDVDAITNFMPEEALLAESADGNTMVLAIPQVLTDALADLDEAKEELAVQRWADTEEFKLDGWLTADVEDYLRDLIEHAQKAKASGKPLLLWVAV
jgi:hypothetical protein